MGVPTSTYQTATQIGQREDLSDIIYSIAPTECPFMSMVGRGSASSIKHEWQTDTLAAAATNAQVEGDDLTVTARVPTVRLYNYTQISTKSMIISGTAEAVDKAGRKSEVAYQIAKTGKEIKRDVEFHAVGQYGLSAGTAATAREAAAVEVWYETNGSYASDGANAAKTGTYQPNTNEPTDGTVRPLTEAMVKGVIQQCWTAGGNPDVIMCGPYNKTVISGFSGGSTRFDIGEDKRLVAAIDVYVSDFGTHRVVPNRFQRERTVHVLDTSMWSLDYLRPFRQFPLAKTGDSEKRQLLVEWTLRSSEEKASGPVADLTTS